MCSNEILFAGDSDIGQLFKIFGLLGTPGPGMPSEWPGVDSLPYWNAEFPSMMPKPLSDQAATPRWPLDICSYPLADDLLRRMLRYDPMMRISAVEALRHPFFQPDRPSQELAPPSMPRPPPHSQSPTQ